MLIIVDLPALFIIVLKMILQIGVCYGYDPAQKREKEFALRILEFVTLDSDKQKKALRSSLELRACVWQGSGPTPVACPGGTASRTTPCQGAASAPA